MRKRFSIVVRTLNEVRFLAPVLKAMKNQGHLIQEVIVVDSGSTDATLAIAKRFQAKIIRIPAADFSYSYSLNVGIEQAEADFIGVFSGHSVPIYPDFLAAGQRYFSEPKVAGVYGSCLPLSNASVVERIYYGFGIFHLWRPPQVIDHPHFGIMGNTNALFPKRLWQEHKFDLKMSEGGEDAEWALYWLKQGFKFIFEPQMTVAHSHGLGLTDFYHQWQHWRKVYRQVLAKHQE